MEKEEYGKRVNVHDNILQGQGGDLAGQTAVRLYQLIISSTEDLEVVEMQ